MGSLKKQIKTVRGKLFLTLCVVVASIIIFLILVNKFVLEKYYQYMKSNALKSVYNQINSYYNGDIQIDDINDELDKISVSNNFDIIIKNDQNIVVYLSNKDFLSNIRRIIDFWGINKKQEYQVIEESENIDIMNIRDTDTRMNYILLTGKLDNGYGVYIRLPLSSIQESVRISNRFLYLIAGIVIIVGGIAITYISKQFSNPISEINQIAKKMSNLDFSHKYVVTDDDEINELGQSINTMSNKLEGTINQLEGRFSFINDLVKYNNRLEELNSLNYNSIVHKKNLLYTEERKYKNNNDKNPVIDWEGNLGDLNIREKDFQKFIFYKNFIANPKVTLITEGKTDSRYIKAALRKYYLDYPNLITKDTEGFKYNIHFLKPSKRLRYFFDYMSGGGGGSVLVKLLDFFSGKDGRIKRNYIKYFDGVLSEENRPQKPTLFLVDNEWQGNKPLTAIIGKLVNDKTLKKEDIERKIKSDFLYHIDLNAFLITLPVESIDDKTNIEIENLFNLDKINDELIAPNHDGKKFDPKKKNADNKNKIGKEIFSNYILSNYDSEVIDYSSFKPLLDLISELSKEYSKFIDDN